MTTDQELLAIYAVEAAEHLGTLNETLLRLETSPPTEEISDGTQQERRRYLESLSRAAHSLKGSSRAVGINTVEKIAHRMESIFDAVLAGKLHITPDIADSLYDALDTMQSVLDSSDEIEIESILTALDTVMGVPKAITATDTAELQAVNPGAALTIIDASGAAHVVSAEESIRVALNKLDDLMADASDLLVARSSIEQRLLDVKTIRKAHQKWQKEWRKVRTLYIRIARQGQNSEWSGLLEFLNMTQRYMRLSNQQLLALDRDLAADSLRLGLISDSLQDNIRRVRLVPFEVHVSLLQRAVRDIARDLHKEVGLQITGAAIELDKRVLESIKDPILHILRNAVDHGIEPPAERARNGKPREGMIILAISQRGGNVLILIADDGRGIDVAAVRQSARRIMSEAEIDALSDADVLSLIMLPGFSTRTQVTSISGRGIGLDVVRQNVEALQGHIDIDSQQGIGTTFRLTLPVSLSTLRCMLARIGEETYAIPTAAIEQIIAIDTIDADARFSAGGREMLNIDGRAVGLVALADVLDRPVGGMAHYALVLSSGERRMAFLVDDLVTEQEMVVKPLNPELAYIRHVSGATLLGSGEVVIILNVADLVKTAQSPAGARQPGQRQPSTPPPQARTILVVDDSITTRTLEKNILEAAGFDVVTATNGLEAMEVLERARCSLVVADIEMPYMDGFELTARIRHSERFGHLPVILVTSLELPEYREQGFQVGADAYIVKGSFNQGELLYTVRQLIG